MRKAFVLIGIALLLFPVVLSVQEQRLRSEDILRNRFLTIQPSEQQEPFAEYRDRQDLSTQVFLRNTGETRYLEKEPREPNNLWYRTRIFFTSYWAEPAWISMNIKEG